MLALYLYLLISFVAMPRLRYDVCYLMVNVFVDTLSVLSFTDAHVTVLSFADAHVMSTSYFV